MLKIFNLKKRNFYFFIAILLFSQSKINNVNSEIKNDQNSINIDYLENTNDNFYILGEGDFLAIKVVTL